MDWDRLRWWLLGAGALAAAYGLHRLAVWMERRGWVNYRYRRPVEGAAGALGAFQQMIEPQARHVIEVRDERRPRPGDGAPGPDGG